MDRLSVPEGYRIRFPQLGSSKRIAGLGLVKIVMEGIFNHIQHYAAMFKFPSGIYCEQSRQLV